MFGKNGRMLATGLILTLFCAYIIRLYIEGKITLYIHPRYAVFALVMSCIGAAVLVAGLLMQPQHHAHAAPRRRVSIIDVIVVIVLACALILPAKPLSWSATEKKALTTTKPAEATSAQKCVDFQPETIESWVFALNEYPIHCYDGAKLTIEGFVYVDSANPLPSDFYHIGKMVMSCCVVDARPFALPVERLDTNYPPGTWLSVNGYLKRVTINGIEQLVIHPDTVQRTQNPDQPYEYLNLQTPATAQPLQQLAP